MVAVKQALFQLWQVTGVAEPNPTREKHSHPAEPLIKLLHPKTNGTGLLIGTYGAATIRTAPFSLTFLQMDARNRLFTHSPSRE